MQVIPEWIGFAAGTLTTLCWAPQVWRIIRTRDTRAISLPTQLTFMAGCSLWLAYGVLMGSPAIILFNGLTITLTAAIVMLKVRMG